MLAEWTIELGADDPRLQIPWALEDGSSRFLDLKRQPELLLEVPEACAYSELAEFLNWANSSESPFETAKCDAWTSRYIDAEDAVFGEPCKFGSYVDLLFVDKDRRSQFSENEGFVQALAKLVRRAPEMASAAEFTVRRCLDQRRLRPVVQTFARVLFRVSGLDLWLPGQRSGHNDGGRLCGEGFACG